jgi:hypothetical protein
MGQTLIPPLVVQRLADLVLRAHLSHRLALEALQHDQCLGLGLSFPSSHG